MNRRNDHVYANIFRAASVKYPRVERVRYPESVMVLLGCRHFISVKIEELS